jgi:Dyp-type peroxidase family
MKQLSLDLYDIQGDVLEGLPKNYESFTFYKILDPGFFKQRLRQHVIRRITSALQVHGLELAVQSARTRGYLEGLNLGFTKDGLAQLIGVRPKLDPPFEKGANHQDTIKNLNDPPLLNWSKTFISDRIDGVFLLAGRDRSSLTVRYNELLRNFGTSVKVVYSEIGNVRPGAERGHEHFGFLDNISQPRVRGLPQSSSPIYRPDEGSPGRHLLWPGEFVFGYPEQHPGDPVKEGPPPAMAAPWMRNGSYMVFRRLEQKVPEFRRFVAERAARLGMDREFLAARMVGRWKSGAPLELAPLRDSPRLGANPQRNNDFGFAEDGFQRKCPYAAHIRKVYPRDDIALAQALRHRIIRAGIPFGPEVAPGETTTKHIRGLMFVCYQTSIERQFEYIQKNYANNPDFVYDKVRPDSGAPVKPGFDPIIGQALGNGLREMDEPFSNYPGGNRRTTLEIPHQFVVLTAAAYFFMPSITALRTVLTS